MTRVVEPTAERPDQRRVVHRPPPTEFVPAQRESTEATARSAPPTSVRSAVLLQRQAGNRATAQLIARQRRTTAPPPAPVDRRTAAPTPDTSPSAPATAGADGSAAVLESEAPLTSLQRLTDAPVAVQRDCGCGGHCDGCGPAKEEAGDSAQDGQPVQRLHQAHDSPVAAVPVQRFGLSDLNPLNALKKLAEKAIGAIRSLGESAWNTAKSLGQAAWNNVKGAGSGIWNAAQSAGGTLLNTAKNLGTAAWNTAKGLGTSAWNTAKSTGAKVWNTAKSAGASVWNTATGLGSKAWSGAKSLGSKIWSGAKSLGVKAWGAIKSFGSTAFGKAKGLAMAAFNGAKSLGGRAWKLAKQAVSKLSLPNLCKAVGAVVGKVVAGVSSAVETAWSGAKRLGAKAWNGAKALGSAVASTASRWAGKAARFATTAVSGSYRTVKSAASSAWNTAKSLGTRAFTGAKQAAAGAWNTAKSLGTKAFSTAKTLGTRVLDKAKDLGSTITKTAQATGRKVLGLADKLTGGAASKVGGVARKILDKAGGLLSWVLNTAKSLASKAINTAKDLGAKAINAAKSAASKAWQTAKEGASTALNTAKQWGSKAFNTAKSLGARAWSTAKQWGSKAVSTAKGWAGKAWNTAKIWGGKAWGAIKSGAGKVWNATKSAGKKAWGAAKDVGRGAVKVAKAVGLDKAWHAAKDLGGKALGAVKKAAGALKKRSKPLLDFAGKAAGSIVAFSPIGMACKLIECAVAKRFCDFLTKFGPLLAGLKKVIADPSIITNAIRNAVAPMIEKVPSEARGAFAQATGQSLPEPGAAVQRHSVQRLAVQRQAATRERTSAPPQQGENIWQGIWRHLGPKLEYLKDNWWETLKQTGRQLLFPWEGMGKDLNELWAQIEKGGNALKSLHFSALIDAVIAAESLIVGILGRWWGWFAIAAVLIGAVIGSIFPVVGTLAGAGAGWEIAAGVGEGLLAADVALQIAAILKALYNVEAQHDTGEDREKDYDQIANSGTSLGITAALVLLGAIAVRFGKAIIGRVRGLRAEPPKVEPPKFEPPKAEPPRMEPPSGERVSLREKVKSPDNVEWVSDPEFAAKYDAEVKVDGHTYRRSKADGTWCRFSQPECGIKIDEIGGDVDAALDKEPPEVKPETHGPEESEKYPAGSPEHKAARWKEYQERTGGNGWDYERWSKVYDKNMVRAKEAHATADAYHDTLGWGEREVTVKVEGENRRLDIADPAALRGVEYKSGYQYRSQENLWELARDEILVKDQGWDIEWVFEEQPSKPLIDDLDAGGIKHRVLNAKK